MRIKFIERGLFCVLGILLVSSSLVAQDNQTLINHKRSRELNKEGYRAYLQENWNLALKKFSQSIKLDAYYTYPLYNSACVLSRRGRKEDTLHIFRLLMEVLLQETGPHRSAHQAKMQKDPDLAWFRRTAPELFILLNDVVLGYNVQRIYRKLRRRKTWNITVNQHRGSGFRRGSTEGSTEDSTEQSYDDSFNDDSFNDANFDDSEGTETTKRIGNPKNLGESLGDSESSEDSETSITVTPDDPPLDLGPRLQDEDSQTETQTDSKTNPSANSQTDSQTDSKEDPFGQNDNFDPFSGSDENPFGNPQGFPGYDDEGREEFFPLVPESLRQQYRESELTLNLISNKVDSKYTDRITFSNYRYKWNFQVGSRLFEMSGFFVVRGNVLILETFASSPKELRGLPFDWKAFRSLFFVYQPQNGEFYAINLNGDTIEIY